MTLAVAGIAVLGLTGCVGGEPLPTLPPSPSSTPIFASEEEALAAAEEAYAAYLEMSNLISSEGGVNPERIASVAAGALYESSLEGFATLRDNQWRTVGASVVDSAKLQFADTQSSQGQGLVAAYICVDFSGLDVLDPNGNSVVSPTRPALQAFEVFFDSTEEGHLVPSAREPWDAAEACADS